MDSTIKKICEGDVRTASRLIRDIEDKLPDAKAKLKKLYAHTGKSFIIGITGAPGAGKSTLTDALISETPAARSRFERLLEAGGLAGVAFALRFHLHPDVDATLDMDTLHEIRDIPTRDGNANNDLMQRHPGQPLSIG